MQHRAVDTTIRAKYALSVPELPDIEVYISALKERVSGSLLQKVLVYHPFLLRSADPPLAAIFGKRVCDISRLGKRIVFHLDDEYFAVLHLMIAGRLAWDAAELATAGGAGGAGAADSAEEASGEAVAAGAEPAGDAGAAEVPGSPGLRGSPGVVLSKRPGSPRSKGPLCRMVFSTGTLTLTEAGSKRRASLHVLRGSAGLAALDPGGLELFEATPEQFAVRLRRENHTIKRALTDPHLFSGIGNAYSDEILHAARLSPFRRTDRMSDAEVVDLFSVICATLRDWTQRLETERAGEFPRKVTAFRKDMAVHGRYGKPCPVCGTPVQRVRYAENESNYCPRCQTDGVVYADRALSRLLKDDWPRTIEELERMGEQGSYGKRRV